MSQLVEYLVKSGQGHSLMIMTILMWESTTIAEILMGILVECGVPPLTQIRCGSTALFHIVTQHTNVKMAIHLVPDIQER